VRSLAPLAVAALLACGKLGTDLDQVVALELVLPDTILVGDTFLAAGRALNGRGDSVAAQIYWSSLDTAIVAVLDSATGSTYGKAAGTGRLQARTGALRSNPQSLIVREP
jgi:hypothetical protein